MWSHDGAIYIFPYFISGLLVLIAYLSVRLFSSKGQEKALLDTVIAMKKKNISFLSHTSKRIRIDIIFQLASKRKQ